MDSPTAVRASTVRLRRRRRGFMLLAAALAPYLLFRLSAVVAPIHREDLEDQGGRLVRFTDRDGEPVGAVLAGGESACQPVTLPDVSEHLLDAFVAAEDERFYMHGGVDYLALARAAGQNLWARRVVSGGSTLTMQLARLLHPRERTPLSKVLEMHTAWRLEAGMTKREILEAYLNRVPMGGNLVGVGAASRAFFGQDPADLSLAQAALLAGIPEDPVRNDPRVGPERAESRRQYVLRRMVRTRRATVEEAQLAAKSRLELTPSDDDLGAYHMMFRALAEAPSGVSEIALTLDADVQRMAAEQVRVVAADLRDRDVTNAAAIVLDNRRREVLAYVGSASYYDVEHSGQVDGVQALRQPGSTLKPFVYALALESGFTAASVLADVPTSYPMGSEWAYEPENYSEAFHGPVLLRSALANSLNVPACRVASEVGVPAVLETLHGFGFESLDREADYYGLGVVLGGGEVTLWELARAYMALANGGRLWNPACIVKADGEPTPVTEEGVRACSLETSFLIGDILSDRDARRLEFGARSPLDLPFPCAAKTGTSSGRRDNWAVGYTPDYTVAVWVGNFSGEEMHEVSGITGAGPLFGRIMYHLYGDSRRPEPVPVPQSVVRLPVCSLSGERPSPCCPHLREEFFTVRQRDRYERGMCDWHHLAEGDALASESDGALVSGDIVTVIPPEFRVPERR